MDHDTNNAPDDSRFSDSEAPLRPAHSGRLPYQSETTDDSPYVPLAATGGMRTITPLESSSPVSPTQPPAQPPTVSPTPEGPVAPNAVAGSFETPAAPQTGFPPSSSAAQPAPTNFSQPQSSPPEPIIQPGVQAVGQPHVGNFEAPVNSPASPMFGDASNQPPIVLSASKKRWPKLVAIAAVAVLLIGGGAAFYFGYYMNSSVILSQSLGNTGKGYTKLVDYFNTQSKAGYKGSTGSGSYNFKSGTTTTDGKLSFQTDGSNSDTTFDVGLAITRVNVEVRTIKSTGATPDIYLKASGIQGLGSDLLGSSQTGTAVDQLDNKWIVIDHTLLDNLESAAGASQASSNTPTEAQIMDEVKAFGQVNQQYVFTTDKNKSVTTVLKKYGVESVGGHKAYHYKMGFNKAHVKQYITAQRDALKRSTLGAWLLKNNDWNSVSDYYNQLEQSANNIKSSDTFDLWSDVHHRVVYKIRVSDTTNPAANFADIGLDYTGGPSYPFFISGQDNTGGSKDNFALEATLNSKTNQVAFKLSGSSGDSSSSDTTAFSANFTYKPSNASVKVSAPSGAEPLSQVLNQLGLGDLLTELQSSASDSSGGSGASILSSIFGGGQDQAKDAKRQTDIQSLQTQLEAFFSQNGYYPSLGDMNNASWLQTNMATLDTNALQDPDGSSQKLAAQPAKNVYAYAPSDSSNQSCESADTNCAQYALTATLSDGTKYSKSNLD